MRAARALSVVYGALILGPTVPLWFDGGWVQLAIGCSVGGVAVLATLYYADVDSFAATRWKGVVGFMLPIIWVVPMLGAKGLSAAVISPWSAGVSASAVWLFIIAADAERRNQQTREDAEAVVEFSARPPRSERHYVLFGVSAVIVPAVVVLFALDVFDSVEEIPLLPLIFVPASLAIMWDEKNVSVTDKGLIVESNIRGWDEYDWYRVEEDALMIKSETALGTRKFDTEDIHDVDAVAEALDEYLPDDGA